MILWMLDRRHRALLQRLFGSEYSAMRRFIELAGSRDEACSDDSPVELFMCAVGIDPQRKQVWDRALTALGTVQETRDSYNELYALQEFDGGTVAGYFDLWSALGLRVN